MTCKTYYQLVKAANESDEKDAYLSKWALSDIWGAERPNDAEWMQRIETLGRIWDAVHLTIREIRAATGLSQVKFGQRFAISNRNIENWEAAVNVCPLYTRLLLAQAVGLYQPPEIE